MSLTQVAEKHRISGASVCRLMRSEQRTECPCSCFQQGNAGASQRGGRCSVNDLPVAEPVLLRRGGLMEDSMFDEEFVTTAEENKEAREALIEH